MNTATLNGALFIVEQTDLYISTVTREEKENVVSQGEWLANLLQGFKPAREEVYVRA